MDTSTWMSHLSDETPVSGLTIPGTHDSAAYTYSFPFVSTQKLSIGDQLSAGVRYLDFRCGVRENVVEMVHGPTYLGLTLASLLRTIYGFLEKHPSEVLVIQIKQDRKNEKSVVTFDYAIFDLIVQDSEFWRTSSTECTLGELRGRIQLLRRFPGPENSSAFGIDVTPWKDNPSSPFTIQTQTGIQVTIQDHYNFPQGTGLPALIRRKGGDVRELLQRANGNPDLHHWFINFVSAYELDFIYQVNPHQIAVGSYWGFRWEEGMNLRLRSFLREGRRMKKRFGIIAMDFPEQGADDLIEALIATNFKQGKRPRDYLQQFWCCIVALLLLCALWCFILKYDALLEGLAAILPSHDCVSRFRYIHVIGFYCS